MAVADVAALIRLHRQEDGRQCIVTVARSLRRHSHEQRIGKSRLGHNCQIHAGRSHRVAGDEAFAKLTSDGGGIAFAKSLFCDVKAGRIDIVLHVPLLQVHLNCGVTEFIDHLHRKPGTELFTGGDAADHCHGTCSRDFWERDDRQEQLHPFDPARLHVAEHIAAQCGIEGTVHTVVLFLLHREIGPQHLFHWVTRGLGDLVVRRVGHRLLDIGRIPPKVRDFLGRIGNGYAFLRRDLIECQC